MERAKLQKGQAAYESEEWAHERAHFAAILLRELKDAPDDKKLLELAYSMCAENAQSILSSYRALRGAEFVKA